jgi:hypothetical protein
MNTIRPSSTRNDFSKKYQNSKNDVSTKYQNSKNDVSKKCRNSKNGFGVRHIETVRTISE